MTDGKESLDDGGRSNDGKGNGKGSADDGGLTDDEGRSGDGKGSVNDEEISNGSLGGGYLLVLVDRRMLDEESVDGKTSISDQSLANSGEPKDSSSRCSGIGTIVNKQACGTKSCITLYNLFASIFGTS